MSPPSVRELPVFILCGGLGTRLGEGAGGRPKPMVEIGDRPIVAHIMACYGRHGFRRFILCTGYRSEVIASYFLNFAAFTNDYTIDLKTQSVSYRYSKDAPDWQITIAHTGVDVMTGARLARAVPRYLGEAEHFAVTYGDGLTDADLAREYAFHLDHGSCGTVLAVNPWSRFGQFELHEDGVAGFNEKPRQQSDWINGGFFFFRRSFLDLISPAPGCVLEKEPLRRLADRGELKVFRHYGFWSCIDTMKDRDEMRALWDTGNAPWLADTFQHGFGGSDPFEDAGARRDAAGLPPDRGS